MAGSVSSGCIEGDVFERALEVMQNGKPTVQRYGIEAADGVAVGLSCGGEVDVLIEPFKLDSAWRAVSKAVSSRRAIAHCVALEPARLRGRHLAIEESGRCFGSIDPEIDEAIVQQSADLLEDGGERQIEEATSTGSIRVFIQALAPPPRLLVIGATHTAIPLIEMASTLGFETFVIDPRSPFAHRERFPTADHLLLEWPDQALSALELDRRCHVLTLSHDLKFDIPALACALRSQVRYIGALGSRRTHVGRLDRLRELGFNDADLARIHTPIGLDLGARTPEEIALAILAEIVAVRHERAGGILRQPPETLSLGSRSNPAAGGRARG